MATVRRHLSSTHWLTAIKETPREQLAGIILDNRNNTGGYQDDLDYLVGSYINEKTEFCQSRYKEGPSRYEYSAWNPISTSATVVLLAAKTK